MQQQKARMLNHTPIIVQKGHEKVNVFLSSPFTTQKTLRKAVHAGSTLM